MKKLILLLTILISISVTANAEIDTFYNELDSDAKASVQQSIANNSYGSLDEMQQAFYNATLLEYINTCTDMNSLYANLESEGITEEILGYTRELDLYQFVIEEELEHRILATLPAESLAEFKANATEQFVLCVLENCNYMHFKELLNRYNDILQLDLSEFDTLSAVNMNNVAKKIVGKSFDNISSLQAYFYSTVTEVKVSTSRPVGGGGVSGGGGGGGSVVYPSSSSTINSVIVDITDTDGNTILRPQNGADVIINVNSTGTIYRFPYVFVAVYDSDGRMKDIYSSAYASEIQFATKYYVGGYVKFFVVSDYTGLIPIHLTKVPMM